MMIAIEQLQRALEQECKEESKIKFVYTQMDIFPEYNETVVKCENGKQYKAMYHTTDGKCCNFTEIGQNQGGK